MPRARRGTLGLGAAILTLALASVPALASPTHLHAPASGHPSTAHRQDAGPATVMPPSGVDVAPAFAGPAALETEAPDSFPFLLAAAGFLALAGVGIRSHRAIPVTLALLLAVSAFEQAQHGVHHLGNPSGADKCVVLAVSAHVDGTAGAAEPDPSPDLLFTPAPPLPPAPTTQGALVD